jgi:D-proline reductase (dithiol) PrdB
MRRMRPPIDYIQRTTEQYDALGYPTYRWVKDDSRPPWAPVRKPLAQSRLALVASGGVYLAGQVAFHFKDDISYREIDTSAPASEFRVSHFAYDADDARSDPNVVFPTGTLRRLVAEGRLGELAERAYSFMGGIYSTRKVRDILAPALAERLIQDEVDLVLLVPV